MFRMMFKMAKHTQIKRSCNQWDDINDFCNILLICLEKIFPLSCEQFEMSTHIAKTMLIF
jgi:hypothetical protein